MEKPGFKKYQKIKRFSTTDVVGIESGICHIFPKLDGTNASVWSCGGILHAGSRNRELSLEEDNAGFYKYTLDNKSLVLFFKEHPNLRMFGEWLVPHTLKTYIEPAWRNFYVFDVVNEQDKYLTYGVYSEILKKYGINFIPPIAIIQDPTDKALFELMETNNYLIQDGEGSGEGIVIKNYDFVNAFGQVFWAKLVRTDFKVENQKVFGPDEIKEKQTTEEKIISKYVTSGLIEKEYSKIVNGVTWESKSIPRLLNTIYYCLITEESWNFIKELKNPCINYKRLQKLTYIRVKKLKPELF